MLFFELRKVFPDTLKGKDVVFELFLISGHLYLEGGSLIVEAVNLKRETLLLFLELFQQGFLFFFERQSALTFFLEGYCFVRCLL